MILHNQAHFIKLGLVVKKMCDILGSSLAFL